MSPISNNTKRDHTKPDVYSQRCRRIRNVLAQRRAPKSNSLLSKLLLALLVLVLLTNCTADTDIASDTTSNVTSDITSDDVPTPTPQTQQIPNAPLETDPVTPEPTPTPDGEPPAPNADGRLVVQSADAHLSTMLANGDDVVALTEGNTINSAANWAPDGSRIAWVSTDKATGDTSIFTDRYDLSDTRSMKLSGSANPHYLAWDPSSSKVAYLSESTGGTDLGLVELLDEKISQQRLDRGSPFAFAWAPTGKNILVHASRFRLDKIDFEEATIIVNENPAQFGAPAWLRDNTLVFADTEMNEHDEATQYLVTTSSSGTGRFPIAQFDDKLRFSVSTQGSRVAIQVAEASDDPAVVTASSPREHTDRNTGSTATLIPKADITRQLNKPTPTPTPGPSESYEESVDPIDELETGIPYLMGLYGGDAWQLSENTATGLFLSPDGNAIAWFERIGRTEMFELKVDADGYLFTSSAMTLSDEFLTMAHNFDQYSQSHAQWSPSNNLFVFSAISASSSQQDEGIWVYNRDTQDLERIADGVLASFSQTEQTSGAASAV